MPHENAPLEASRVDKKTYLRDVQYLTTVNLEGRITLHERFSARPNGDYWIWLWNAHALAERHEVLEVGCGRGDFWRWNAARVPVGLQAILTDLSEGMLESARDTLRTIEGFDARPFDFVVADVESLPFPTARFDRVIANAMLYHAVDKTAALRECARVLKPGGRLGLATSGTGHMSRILECARSIDPSLDWAESGSASFDEKVADAVLSRFFRTVEKSAWDDALNVTDPSSVVAYFRTSSACQISSPGEEFYAEMERRVDAEIRERGAFHIPKRAVFYACMS